MCSRFSLQKSLPFCHYTAGLTSFSSEENTHDQAKYRQVWLFRMFIYFMIDHCIAPLAAFRSHYPMHLFIGFIFCWWGYLFLYGWKCEWMLWVLRPAWVVDQLAKTFSPLKFSMWRGFRQLIKACKQYAIYTARC